MAKDINSDIFQEEVMQAIEKYKPFYEDGVRHKPSPPPEEAEKEAQKLLERKDIRHYLCPALQSISTDVYDIGKTIVAILIPLALSKAISISVDPIIFGVMAIMISKMGIAGLCADFPKEKNKE